MARCRSAYDSSGAAEAWDLRVISAEHHPTPDPGVPASPDPRPRGGDASDGPHPTLRAAAVVLAAGLAFAGVQLLHRTEDFAQIPNLPTGILGGIYAYSQWVLTGTIVILLGCLLAFLCLPLSLLPMPDRSAPTGLAPRTEGGWEAPRWLGTKHLSRKGIGLISGGVAGCIYLYVLVQAHTQGGSLATFAAFMACLALFVFATSQLSASAHSGSRYLQFTGFDAVIVPVIMLAVAWFTLRDVADWRYSFVGDEWSFYTFAKQIAGGYPVDLFSQYGVYGYHPVLDSAYQALAMIGFGQNVFGWRMGCIVSVVLPLPILYWGAKQMGGSGFAVATAVIYAASPLFWAYAHIGYNNLNPLLYAVPSACFFYVGVRDDRPVLLMLAGICLGLAWYTFFTGRLMVVILGAVAISEWRGGWRMIIKRLAFLFGGFVFALLPFVLDNGSTILTQMIAQTSLSHQGTGPDRTLLLQNTVRTAYAFILATENGHYVLGALFDVVSGAALCIGVALALRTVKSLISRLMLCWFAGMLVATGPFFYAPQIPETRLQLAVPVAALLASFGLCTACRALQVALLRRGTLVCRGILACLLLLVVGLNVHQVTGPVQESLQPALIALTVGAIRDEPTEAVILLGDTSNFVLCGVLDGYEIDPSTAYYFKQGHPLHQCESALGHRIPQFTSALVLVNTADLPTVQSCRRYERLLLSWQGVPSIWGFRVAVPAGPPGSYLDRLTSAVLRVCPTIVS